LGSRVLGLQHLPTGEGQKLWGERSRPVGGLLHLLQLVEVPVSAFQVHEKELGVPGDDGEEVVEVVCNPSLPPFEQS
jgi:hypothetical protein